MKKLTWMLSVLAAALLVIPALAADSEAPHYDLLDLDGPEPAAVYQDPARSPDAPADSAEETPMPVEPTPTPVEPTPTPVEPTPTPIEDVPVDESTYREEPSTPYEPPVRLPGRGEIDDILAYWEEHGYPGDVSYAFEAGGEVMEDGTVCAWWEIGLVDADEERKQEILDLVSPDCLVEFQNCLFTHAEKQAAYDKLTELAADDPNILEVIFIRNGDNVWVSVPEEKTKEYAEYLIRDLGLGAVVSVTDQHSIASFEGGLEIGIATPGGIGMGIDGALDRTVPQAAFPATGALVPDEPKAPSSPVFWVCLALAVIAACGLTFPALRRRFARLAVTVHGHIRTAGAPLTRAQTEQLVRGSTQVPPDGLLRTIVERGEGEP